MTEAQNMESKKELSVEEQKALEASDMSLDENGVPKNGIITKTIIKEGAEGPKPRFDHQVTVHYVGKLESGKVFDESRGRGQPMTVILNRGQLIPGFEAAIQTMRLNETASFLIHADKAYGSAGTGADIPPNSNLIFEIELLSFGEKERDLEDMNGDELMLFAQDQKNEGNKAIKEKKYEVAVIAYKKGIEAMKQDAVQAVADSNELESALNMNLALSYINLQEFGGARNACDEVLNLQPKHLKARFRKSLALSGLGMLEEARDIIYDLCVEEPKNKEFRATYEEIKKKLADHREKEKEIYGKMYASAPQTKTEDA